MNDAPLFRSRAGIAFLMIAGFLLVIGLTQSASQPAPTDGPAGSSFATHGDGSAALVDLLEANGYNVARERRPLAERTPGRNDVLVVINGRLLSAEDELAMIDHVAGGGRLVAIGSTWLNGITDSAPTEFERTSRPSRSTLAIAGFVDVEQAQSEFVWVDAGSMLPLVGNDDGMLAGIEYLGDGVVVAIADDALVSNRLLDAGDNALLALLAIGEPEGTVRFIEYIHGFTQPTGLAALPTRWQQALLVLALAGFVWLAAHGRRFGPAEETSRGLSPPRSAYVDALALTIEASKDPNAAATLDEALTAELTRRGAALGSSASILEVALSSGVDAATADRALSAGTGREDTRAKAILLSHLVNKEQL